LDEINDTTAVALEIFKLIPAAKKIGLGETNQAIYHFLNLVNGFEEMNNEPVLYLTHSWRCSEEIAESIQTFMRRDVSENFNFVGTDNPVDNGKFLYCTMTNALIVSEIQNRIYSNKGFNLLRKISDIFAAPMAVASAASGKVPYQKKYGFLADEYKKYLKNRGKGESYMSYLLNNVDDFEVQSAVKLLMSFSRKGINLFDLYKKAKDSPVDLNYTIATVFTSKGLEFETVEIGDDLNAKIESVRANGGIETAEDLVAYRCYYVACSRAGKNLLSARALSA
jgi:superfamily I DNA/RNA helicase